MKKNRKHTESQKGFTLIETLVAISILLIATTGPLSFAQSGLRASFLARDQVTAFYLAQDVIETIKNIRDNNSLSGQPWLSNLLDCEPSGTDTVACGMDTAQIDFGTMSCPLTGCIEQLNYDTDARQFVLDDTDVVSKYTRTIYLTELVPDREAQIVVEVKWDSNFFSEKRIVVQENIYNWVPTL